jgi:hypothetical protein
MHRLNRRLCKLWLLALTVGALTVSALRITPAAAQSAALFKEKVQPIFAAHCAARRPY